MAGMTIKDFAEHIGVASQTIRNAIKRGRVRVGPDGYINAATEAKRFHQTRDLSKVRSHSPPPPPLAELSERPRRGRPATVSTHEASEEAASYEELKTKKLGVDLDIAREELSRLRASTVNKDEVRRALTSFSRLIRDKWINFPDRYGATIAAAVGCDPKLLMAELGKSVRLQLDEIANAKPTLPEG